MNVVFLGPPGSGKGTQAKQLAAAQRLVHVSTGDVFRDAIKAQSELGREIKAFVDAGKLVPDELVSEVVFEKLKSIVPASGFLLDGYPRTMDQAKALDDFAKRSHFAIDAVIFFDINFDVLTRRLSARRQCVKCKEVYNLEAKPPRTKDRCDICGGDLIQRDDDQVNVVQERLTVYSRQTQPVLDYYQGRPQLHKVKADQDISAVYADLSAALGIKVS